MCPVEPSEGTTVQHHIPQMCLTPEPSRAKPCGELDHFSGAIDTKNPVELGMAARASNPSTTTSEGVNSVMPLCSLCLPTQPCVFRPQFPRTHGAWWDEVTLNAGISVIKCQKIQCESIQ